MRITDTSDLWFKNAVVYCLDVKRYADSNGDGWGDFQGLSRKVDYLADLGVTCIWLMPFYASPLQDDGYDISDFYAVDPRLGTLGDVVEFLRTAHDRGMRVIVDLVPNHTSVQHPWFQSARKGPGSKYHDWYVWSDELPKVAPADVAFPGEETSIWEYDEECGRYFLHRFYRFQPDLDVSNPEVRDEITRIAGFWTELGVDGFRMDAVPALLQTDDDEEKARLPDPHEFLRDLRSFLGRRKGETFLLGEANLPHDQQKAFFGSGSSPELSGAFDFITMANLWLSMARGDAAPLAHAIEARPAIPPECQWATFVRNHDELTLDRLTGAEKLEVFAAFGPKKSMQVYNRGLRRRLAAMLDGDQDRLRLVLSLLFSLPGTPVIFYGDEIGMGENLAAEGRLAVRTPMQWTRGTQRRVLDRARRRPGVCRRARRARAEGRQRRGPAAGPGVAALVRPVADPGLPGVPGAGLGHVQPAGLRGAVGAGAPGGVGGPDAGGAAQPGRQGGHRVGAAAERGGSGRVGRAAGHPVGDQRREGRAEGQAAALRQPLAAARGVAVRELDCSTTGAIAGTRACPAKIRRTCSAGIGRASR